MCGWKWFRWDERGSVRGGTKDQGGGVVDDGGGGTSTRTWN